MPAKGCFAEPLAKLDAILAQFGGTSAAPPPGGAKSKAPAATPAPSAAGTEGRSTQLAAQITAVGDEIRAMKKAKATKEEVMAKVETLKGLKAEFLAATGAAYVPPAQPKSDGGGKKKKKKKGDGGGAAPEPEPEDPAVAARLAAKFATIRSIGEECVTEDDLRLLLKKKPDSFRLYDGFEPSGRMHIAQGVFKAINVNKCTSAGGTFCFWVADWFALMNDKMGGDLDKIKDVGQYFVEVWKAAGMDMSSGKVEFRWASDDITKNAGTYWPQMLDIARRFTLARIMKCCTIMGRAEGNLTAAQILYPIMQCTDIFFLRADICQLGVDQRKVNMLAREYCTAAGIKLKPVILSHHMLYGLKAGQAKMSKSDPDSAIFMEDTKADIARKLSKAYCPKAPPATGAVADCEMRLVIDDLQNPCLDYVEHIILSRPGAVFAVPGGASYSDFASVRAAFLEGKLSEEDLKAGLVEAVDALVAPVRNHFRDDEKASALFARVQEYKAQAKAGEGGAAVKKPHRRLDRFPGATNVHLVCAPLPLSHVASLGAALTVLARVRTAPAGSKVVLWLPDWSALVLSCLDGDTKTIAASFTQLVEAVKALDEVTRSTPGGLAAAGTAPPMTEVEVVFQSEAILSNPSDYWISVINVGRQLKLNQVKTGYLPGAAGRLEAEGGGPAADATSEAAGCVVSSLMHVGDVMGVAPATIPCGAGEDDGPHKLALDFWRTAEVTERNGLSIPQLVASDPVSTVVDASKGVEYVIGDDPKAGANKKMKQAFCEPGNIDRNPPLTVARDIVIRFLGGIELNGRTYTSVDWSEAVAAFAKDDLTPQIVKPAVTAAMGSLLDAINARAKSDSTAKKAEQIMKAFIKKQKQKKKK